MIYMDHAATTALHPEAARAMEPYQKERYGNPSGAYELAGQAKEAVERARMYAAKLIGARAEEICFTSGGTESDNWALRGVAEALSQNGKHIITTNIEHPAILQTCRYLERHGYEITYLGADGEGRIDIEGLKAAIRPDTILVSVMMANNEIGTIEPIREMGMLLHRLGIVFHTDAVQACGQIPIDVNYLMVDLLSASGHKLYGPKGSGFLYIRTGTPIVPLIYGGGQEKGRRSGTENVPAIVGLGEAARIAGKDLYYRKRQVQWLRDYMYRQLNERIPNLRLNGSGNRLPGNLNISIKGVNSAILLRVLKEAGVCVSARSACSSSKGSTSHVLKAISVPEEFAAGTLRITLGSGNTKEEVDYVVELLAETVEKVRKG